MSTAPEIEHMSGHRAPPPQTTNAAIMLDSNRLTAILDYVKEHERRFEVAYADTLSARATCRLESVRYTVHKTNYLSVAELAVAVAQLAHVHIDCFVTLSPDALPISARALAARRRAHEIVFADFHVRCAAAVRGEAYELRLALLRTFIRGKVVLAKYEFAVNDGAHTGHFLAHAPGGGVA